MLTMRKAELDRMIRAAVEQELRAAGDAIGRHVADQLDRVRGRVPDSLPIEDDDVRRARIRKALRAHYPGTRGF